MPITFAARQSKTAASSDPASITLDAAPIEGNLLVASATERSGTTSANHTISGTGWTKRIARDANIADSTYRRTLTVWTKVAGASEPATITVDDGTANAKRLLVVEFEAGTEVTWTFQDAASNDNGAVSNGTSVSTGTTGSVAAGDILQIGALAVKGPGSAVDLTATWASRNLVTVAEADLTASFDRALYVGAQQQSDAGTRTSTASIDVGNNVGLVAGTVVFTAVASGGPVPGSVDLAGSYAILSAGTSDLAGSYGIAAAGTSDLAASYAILSAGSADLAGSYAILSSGSADLTCAYQIQGLAAVDFACSYAILSAGTADVAASYAILSAGSVDLACIYAIETSTTGGRDLACSYGIALAGQTDLASTYAVALAGYADLSAEFSVRVGGNADLPAEYQIASSGAAGLTCSYSINASGFSDLLASYAVLATGGVNFSCGYQILSLAFTFPPFTFDGASKIITVDPGVTSFTAEELWFRWGEWYASGSNATWSPAMRHVGGDDLGGGLYIPNYILLLNGWRVRPFEGNHTLIISGNLFVDGGGGVPVVQTLGDFNVSVQYTVPVLTSVISPGLTLQQAIVELMAGVSGTPGAVLAAAQAAPIHADARRMNGSTVAGTGQSGDLWRGA